MTLILRAICAVILAVGMTALPKAAEAQPTFSKIFSPSTIGPGGTSVLTFTISNGEAPPVSDLDFTDVLPAGVTIADPVGASVSCSDGTLTAPANGGTISYTGGRLGSADSCTISVNVTSSTVGMHTNTSGDLTSSAGNSGSATDDLEVVATLPGFAKSFAPGTISLGGRSTLTFTIDNSSRGCPR